MNEPQTARKQFFIATNNGHISSEHVVAVYPTNGNKNETTVRTSGGSEYSHTGTIALPFESVKQIFTDHGYSFVDPAAAAQAAAGKGKGGGPGVYL